MQFLDPDHPFFRHAWRRWATALLPAAWGLFELASGNPFWALIFGAAGGYAFWVLIWERRGRGGSGDG